MLTMIEAAEAAGVSRSTLYAKLDAGELSCTPGGTLDPLELLGVFGEWQVRRQGADTAAAARMSVAADVAGHAAAIIRHVAWLRGLADDQRAVRERKERDLHDAQSGPGRHEPRWWHRLEALTMTLLPASEPRPTPTRSFLRRVLGG